jgi:hypothetical protein
VLFSSIDKGLPRIPSCRSWSTHHELLNKAGNPAYDYWMEMAALNVPDEQTVDGHIARRVAQLMDESAKGDKPFFLARRFSPAALVVGGAQAFLRHVSAGQDGAAAGAGRRSRGQTRAPPSTRGAPDMTDRPAPRRDRVVLTPPSRTSMRSSACCSMRWIETSCGRTRSSSSHPTTAGTSASTDLWGKVTLFQEGRESSADRRAPGVARPERRRREPSR